METREDVLGQVISVGDYVIGNSSWGQQIGICVGFTPLFVRILTESRWSKEEMSCYNADGVIKLEEANLLNYEKFKSGSLTRVKAASPEWIDKYNKEKKSKKSTLKI